MWSELLWMSSPVCLQPLFLPRFVSCHDSFKKLFLYLFLPRFVFCQHYQLSTLTNSLWEEEHFSVLLDIINIDNDKISTQICCWPILAIIKTPFAVNFVVDNNTAPLFSPLPASPLSCLFWSSPLNSGASFCLSKRWIIHTSLSLQVKHCLIMLRLDLPHFPPCVWPFYPC